MKSTKSFPRFMICAPASGSGKTLITCALLRILVRRGLKPASFKCGPDYIDPMFHKKVLEIPSRNLDRFLMGVQGLKKALCRGAEGRDIGVIEGVMGFYDGISATSFAGSSYDICRMTETPAVLVVNCRGMSRSVIATVKGFCDYGEKNVIRGIILNHISQMVAPDIKAAIEEETGLCVLGALPKLSNVTVESRHLGLVLPEEIPGVLAMFDHVADELEKTLDIERLLQIADEAGGIVPDCDSKDSFFEKTRIGIAMDEAFCFYYEDNLELLKAMGAKLVFFSPIHDRKLPDVSRLILGGGYPELYAKELSENVSMRENIRNAAQEGMPILAECGGFLYLKESLSDPKGKNYEMAGVFPGHGYLRKKLHHFGYVTMTALADNPYLMKNEEIRAHEFHYCDTTDNGELCRLEKPSHAAWPGYQIAGRAFGGFAHLYYPSLPGFIERFME